MQLAEPLDFGAAEDRSEKALCGFRRELHMNANGRAKYLSEGVTRNVIHGLGLDEVIGQLRALRRAFAKGGLPPADTRGPVDDVRIAVFHAVRELLGIVDQFKSRIASGEALRLVVREQPVEPGRVLIELAIEPRGEGRDGAPLRPSTNL